jgi:hypothetical protein
LRGCAALAQVRPGEDCERDGDGEDFSFVHCEFQINNLLMSAVTTIISTGQR